MTPSTLQNIRAGVWAAAGCGLAGTFAYALTLHGSIFLEGLAWGIPPYIMLAVAGFLGKTRGLAVVALLAALSVLALEAYMLIDLARSVGSINDIELEIVPLQWMVAGAVLVAGGIGAVVRKIKNAA
jgi:hypothetical protein